MSSEQLLLTVDSGSRRVEVVLPTDTPIAELVPRLLEVCGIPPAGEAGDRSQWVLALPDGEVLLGNRTLSQYDLGEESLIQLRDVVGAPLQPAPPTDSTADTPRPVARRVKLPPPTALPRRLQAMGEALVAPGPSRKSGVLAAAASAERLRIPRAHSALERARGAWHDSDYRSQLDEMISAPRLTRCATIAVISPKGGVGKTTTAALLGTLLAMIRSDRVIAVDSNPDYGTLGRSLAPEHPIFVDDLLDVIHQPALTVTMLERCLGRASHGLLVLPAPTEPERMEKLDHDAYDRVIRRLQELAGIIVLDCGAGLQDQATRAAMEAADQLVLVSDAEPPTASLVAGAALRLAGSSSFTVVVNKVPRSGGRLDLGHLAEDLGAARGLIRINQDVEAAARVADGEFSWDTAPEAWQVALRELAAVLAVDWEDLGLTA